MLTFENLLWLLVITHGLMMAMHGREICECADLVVFILARSGRRRPVSRNDLGSEFPGTRHFIETS